MEPARAPWRILESDPDPEPARHSTASSPAGRLTAILGIAAVAALSLAAFAVASQPASVVEIEGAATGSPVVTASAEAADIVVEVGGAVARPGVYTLTAGARVGDAIAAAGGYGPTVDVAAADIALNLAATLIDGQELRVPGRGDPPAAGSGGAAAGAGGTAGLGGTGGLVNVNTASATELDTLPGVGPATAAKIIAAREERPFASVDELHERKVVGTATFEKLRSLITIGP